MQFQIEKIIVWPIDSERFPRPREVEFKLNCVNVISGESRTGKSAIVAIIDYCLGSDECTIPGGKVRDNASWFGVIAAHAGGRLLLARRNPPPGTKSTGEFYIQELGKDEPTPSRIIKGDFDVDYAVDMLSKLAGIPALKRTDSGASQDEKITFRDVAHLLLQPQDIVASRLIMFNKMNEYWSKVKLSNWFNFVLGAESEQDVRDKIRLEAIRLRLDQIERQKKADLDELNRWVNDLSGNLRNARALGLVDEDEVIPEDKKELLLLAKKIVDDDRSEIKPKHRSKSSIDRELKRLDDEYQKLNADATAKKRRLDTASDLRTALIESGDVTAIRRDRLQISKWIEANWKPTQICPVCGGATHSAAKSEVEKICREVLRCETAVNNIKHVPETTQAVIDLRQREYDEAAKKLSAKEAQIKVLENEKREVRGYLEEERQRARLIQALKDLIKLNEATLGKTEIDAEAEKLRAEEKEIRRRYNQAAIKARAKAAQLKICELTLGIFKSLDSEDIYQSNLPEFDEKNLTVKLADTKNVKYSLSEVGSASNWVSLHVALTCALQEYLTSLTSSCVPNFVVYDQPSQVYFPSPKLVRNDEPNKPDKPLVGKDLEAMRKMFAAINQSTKKGNRTFSWQAIVLEHAGEDVYGAIPNINKLKPWRDGEALIPHEWYESNEAIPE